MSTFLCHFLTFTLSRVHLFSSQRLEVSNARMSRCLLVALANGEGKQPVTPPPRVVGLLPRISPLFPPCLVPPTSYEFNQWHTLPSLLLFPPPRSGEIRVYHEKHLSWTHSVASPVTGMWFGRYGREDNTLIIVCKNGALEIKVGMECSWSAIRGRLIHTWKQCGL